MLQKLGSIGPRLRKLMISLRTSFWFIPLIFVVASLVVALILIEVDSHVAYKLTSRWPRLFGAGAEGSRGMLSTIAGSIMTMMGLTFSMTLITLSLASTQYSSRVLRTFIRDRVTQTVLGVFAGIFTYCLVVLRTIREGDASFIPSISIFCGFVFALFGVGVIVFFIHHIASSIQASNIIANVAEETIEAISGLYPIDEKKDKKENDVFFDKPREVGIVVSNKSGYIQTVDETYLVKLAHSLDSILYVDYKIGDFVVCGKPLVSLSKNEVLSKEDVSALGESFSIQRYRTIEQDPLFGIRQIVDIALKALSPGINDTTTSIVCIDYLASILSFLINRKIPSTGTYKDGELRLVLNKPSYSEFLKESFSQIAKSGRGNLVVQERILWSLQVIASMTDDKKRWSELGNVVGLVEEIVKDSFSFISETETLSLQIRELRNTLQLEQ